jgi:hypothetical protein
MRFVLIKGQICRLQPLRVATMLRALPQHRQATHSTSPCLHLDYRLRILIKPTIPLTEAFLLPNDPSTHEKHERTRCTRMIPIPPSHIIDAYCDVRIARSNNTKSPRVLDRLYCCCRAERDGFDRAGYIFRSATGLSTSGSVDREHEELAVCIKRNSNCITWHQSVSGTFICSCYKQQTSCCASGVCSGTSEGRGRG